MSSELCSVVCSSDSTTSSNETSSWSFVFSSLAWTSISGFAVSDNSAKSSFEIWIFSGALLALLEGKIGAPLLEISPL